jgi:D-alanine-D-alanine ligase
MPKKKIKVGVIFGGRSGEHEVSIVSAQSVIDALDKKKYDVVPIGITKVGKWVAGPQSLALLKSGAKKSTLSWMLPADPTEKRLVSLSAPQASPGVGQLDVVFPVLHGPYGEDGTIQGLLDLADIPYVGAGVLGSAIGMDKIVQKELLTQAGFPLVKYVWFFRDDWQKNQSAVIPKIKKSLKYPIFTKPVNMGSSVGINKCRNQKELIAGIAEAARYDRKIIVEEGISNPREIEVAVLGNDNPVASVPGEIISSNEFYDYDAKYVDGKSHDQIPAKLPKPVSKKIQTMAVDAFKALDLAGMARVDFLVTKSNTIYLNEVNTIPGFTSISMYPKLWAKSGLAYPQLLDQLVQLAIERHQQRSKLATSYKPKSKWYT